LLFIALAFWSSAMGCSDGGTTPGELVFNPQSICNGEWCWANPLPQGADLRSVSGTSVHDAWAVGPRVLLHWDGTRWNQIDGPGAVAVWVAGSGDVWLTTGTDVYRGNQNGFQHQGTWGGQAISGTNADDVWVASSTLNGVDVHHWRSGELAVSPVPPELVVCTIHPCPAVSLLARATNEVWLAVGQSVLRWDGAQWSRSLSAPSMLRSIWIASQGDGWVVGDGGQTWRRSGGTWSLVPSGTTADLRGVWSLDGKEVWIAGARGTFLRWTGSGWSQVADVGADDLTSIWGDNPSALWLVGNRGATRLWNGARISTGPLFSGSLNAIWSVAPGDAWAVGEGGLAVHWDGTAWSQQDAGTDEALRDVWAAGKNDVWAVGESGAPLHWNGSHWERVPTGTNAGLSGVFGSGSADVWTVGPDAGFWHWGGSAWTSVPSPSCGGRFTPTCLGPSAVWVRGPTEAWTSGAAATIEAWDGGVWAFTSYQQGLNPPSPAQSLSAIWGTPNGTLFINGEGPVPCAPADDPACAATARTFIRSPEAARNGLWGVGDGDVWAIGTELWHFDGAVWTNRPVPGINGRDLGGTTRLEWLVGTGGSILHRLPGTGP